LVKLENDQVSFKYKDSNTKTWLTKTLPVFKFMHDFLQHVLPRGFKKVRHYGFLSSKHKQTLTVIKYILGTVEIEPVDEKSKEKRKRLCSVCGKEMLFVGKIKPLYQRGPP
jgi:hypothetical protein